VNSNDERRLHPAEEKVKKSHSNSKKLSPQYAVDQRRM
jgi:hypothetical protein